MGIPGNERADGLARQAAEKVGKETSEISGAPWGGEDSDQRGR
jgi:hypothetical protein